MPEPKFLIRVLKIDPFLNIYGLTILFLSYLFMPYPVRAGLPTFSAIAAVALAFWAMATRKRLIADKLILILLSIVVISDLFFILFSKVNLTIFRAHLFGLLTCLCAIWYANPMALKVLLRSLVIWIIVSFILILLQLIAGDYFFLPLWFKYFGGIKPDSMSLFCWLTTPVGFNIAKTQLAGQVSFFVPLFLCLAPQKYLKNWVAISCLTFLMIIATVSFSRAAWLAIFFTTALIIIMRFRTYWKMAFLIYLLFLLTMTAFALDTRKHRLCWGWPNVYYTGACLIQSDVLSDLTIRYRFTMLTLGLKMFKDNPAGGGSGAYMRKYRDYEKKAEEHILLAKKAEKSPLDANGYSGEYPKLPTKNYSTDRSSNNNSENKKLPSKLFPTPKQARGTPETVGAHNTFLSLLVEKGWLLFSIFIFVLLRTLYYLHISLKRRNDLLSLAAAAGLVGMIVYSLGHVTLTDRMFWLALGLALAASKGVFRHDSENEIF